MFFKLNNSTEEAKSNFKKKKKLGKTNPLSTYLDFSVKSPRPSQGRVNTVRSVGGSYHNYTISLANLIHQLQ